MSYKNRAFLICSTREEQVHEFVERIEKRWPEPVNFQVSPSVYLVGEPNSLGMTADRIREKFQGAAKDEDKLSILVVPFRFYAGWSGNQLWDWLDSVLGDG